MKRIAGVVIPLAITATASTAAASSTMPDPVAAFTTWATEQGHPVSQAACWTDAASAVCYGLADDAASVVVAFGVPGEDGAVSFVASPVVLPATDAAASSSPAAAGELATTFSTGTWLVGVDIAPGTYRSDSTGDRTCFWYRLSGLSGDSDDVLAADSVDGPAAVEISPDDVGFDSSEGCGTWTQIAP